MCQDFLGILFIHKDELKDHETKFMSFNGEVTIYKTLIYGVPKHSCFLEPHLKVPERIHLYAWSNTSIRWGHFQVVILT